MERTIYPAHIKNQGDNKIVQTVAEHCRKAGEYAYKCLADIGLGNAAQFAAECHDMGKERQASYDYQWAIANGENVVRGSVNHTFAAVKMILERYHHGENIKNGKALAAEIIAYAMGAHHGLFDCFDFDGKNGFKYRIEKTNIEYEQTVRNFIRDCMSIDEYDKKANNAFDEINKALRKIDTIPEKRACDIMFYFGVLARLLLSAVMEGDRRDTAKFMTGASFPKEPVSYKELWDKHLERVEKMLDMFPCENPMQRVRRAISEQCAQAAGNVAGICRLSVPTGGGKTLASLRFALAQASKKGRRRIVYVMPLLAIIEQNAKEIRNYIGDDAIILEHHSNIVSDEKYEKKDELDSKDLLRETWDSPIIITTLVQMLDTMFSGKTSGIRRMHSLCDSIIIFDEIQTVPTKMLSQFNLMINFLSTVCNCDVVLCSATQPPLEKASKKLLRPTEIVKLDKKQLEVFNRTDITYVGSKTTDEIERFVCKKKNEFNSILVICNTRKVAADIYGKLRHMGGVYHLSAAMCMKHREDTLDIVKKALSREKTILISTQVIEAGVDISFECVIRLTAGMDSIIQAAGRCNRHGELQKKAPVYVITCNGENLSSLVEINRGKTITCNNIGLFQRNPEKYDNDLSSKEFIDEYYSAVYECTKNSQDYPVKERVRKHRYLFDLLSSNMEAYENNTERYCSGNFCMHQAFSEAGKLFKVFDDNTTDIIVPYGNGKDYIVELCSERAKRDFKYVAECINKAKPYSVSVYENQLKKLNEYGVLIPIESIGGLALLDTNYDFNTGIVMDAAKNNLKGDEVI